MTDLTLDFNMVVSDLFAEYDQGFFFLEGIGAGPSFNDSWANYRTDIRQGHYEPS
jgi:hypothetical protein